MLEIIEIVKPEKISKYIDNDLKIIIKIDTEGYEQIILNEIYKTDFWKNVYAIFLEINIDRVDEKRILDFFLKNNFICAFRNSSDGHYDALFTKNIIKR